MSRCQSLRISTGILSYTSVGMHVMELTTTPSRFSSERKTKANFHRSRNSCFSVRRCSKLRVYSAHSPPKSSHCVGVDRDVSGCTTVRAFSLPHPLLVGRPHSPDSFFRAHNATWRCPFFNSANKLLDYECFSLCLMICFEIFSCASVSSYHSSSTK